MTGPLADIRVLDLAGEAGLYAGRQLAELGADVIRVEPPGGDRSRQRSPFLGDTAGPERSLYHLHFNAGKRGVVLDLETPEGIEQLQDLASTADVLIETAAPGAMDAKGIGYAALGERNPALIYTTITPFGQDGPFRDYRGNDLIGAATSGLLYLNGFAEDPPNLPGAEQAYHMASLVAVSGTLLALTGCDRDPQRRGRRIDVSIQEATSMATVQTANANFFTWHGEIVKRGPLPAEGQPARGLFRSREGQWLSFTVPIGAPALWDAFVDWLREEGIESEIAGDEWHDPAYRMARQEPVTAAVAELTGRYTRDELVSEGQRRRQLVMPVNAAPDLVADEQLAARGFFVEQEHPEAGAPLLDSGTPFHLSTTPASLPRRAPLLGEHTDEVLAESRPTPTPAPDGATPAATVTDRALPLAGLRVLDFCWMIAGPAGSRVLSDLGAEVIRVESEYRVDNIRRLGVFPDNAGTVDTNAVFYDCNTGKRSIALNLNTPRGIEIAKRLVAMSDIVTNNFTGDRMDRWGLGYEDLRKIKPEIVMLTMPVMGTTGPRKHHGSYGNGVIAFGGLNSNMGLPERPPVGMAPLYSDFSSPYFFASAIAAALHHRECSGEGQFIDLAQAEATVSLLGTDVMEYTANGEVAPRSGNRVRDFCPHGVYRCEGEDRWCAIAARDDEDWKKLAAVIDEVELSGDERFSSHAARKQHEDELDALIEGWTRERDAWDVMHTLQAAGVMAGVAEDLEDMVARDPGLPGRHLIAISNDDEAFEFTVHAQPLRLDGEVPPLDPAPAFGEANQYVYRKLLGFSEDEYVQLIADNVIF